MEKNLAGRFISADGHLVEPKDLFTTRIDKRFRDRAPWVDSQYEGDYYMIDGIPPIPIGLEGAALEQKLAGKVENFMGQRHGDTRPGGWDPQARLADQDLDNLQAEVIYPGVFGLMLFNAPDAEYQRACTQAYNDWINDFNAVAPDRFLGVSLLPAKGPVEWAIEEAQRVAKKGARSVALPIEVPERPYSLSGDTYEPLWAALQDLSLPVAFHAGTGTGETVFQKFMRLGFGVTLAHARMQPGIIGELIFSGVAQRYPKLNFMLVETGIGWIASILSFMDHFWSDHQHWLQPKLDEKPSFYFKRQFWATFEEDPAGIATRHLLNVDHLMWGSDYPHTEGTFPHSREQVAKDFAGMAEGEVYKIVAGNAARLYGLT